MDVSEMLNRQRGYLEQAVLRYQELVANLNGGHPPAAACYFFDQCVIGRIAESVVSAVDTGYIAELEERIRQLEREVRRCECRGDN